jgi:hypothetical protein
LLGVFAHRAIGGEARCQPRHAFPHPRDPGGGNALIVAVIELGDHLTFERVVEHLRFGVVPAWIGAMVLPVAQRPGARRPRGTDLSAQLSQLLKSLQCL